MKIEFHVSNKQITTPHRGKRMIRTSSERPVTAVALPKSGEVVLLKTDRTAKTPDARIKSQVAVMLSVADVRAVIEELHSRGIEV